METDASARPQPAASARAERTAIVTGASRGIGHALVRKLAAAGVRVVAAARSADDLQSLAQGASDAPGEVVPVELDVADPASVERFAARVRERFAVDVLVNNAGVGVFAPVEELTLQAWDRVFDVNVRGTFLVTQAFLADLRARKGHIVNVTSDVSDRTFAGGSCYTASKSAQRAFTRALQMEVQGDGVRVTEIRPGRVATHFGSGEPPPVGVDHLSPEDVADTIMYALERPARVRLDEIHFHPMGQAAEF
jgi:NADP-dependent 3-hydroxy acid dehydrogenase YdfG